MIPKFQDFLYPFLLTLKDGVVSKKEMKTKLAEYFHLSEADLALKTKSGKFNMLSDRIGWSVQYFRRALFIDIPQKGFYKLTDRGTDYLKTHDSLTIADLLKYPEFSKFYNPKKKPAKPEDDPVEPKVEPAKKEPIEILEELSEHINETLESNLLEALKKMKPESFERLIKELLVKMNITQSEKCIELTPYAKDDGVDVYVYDNILKMNVICCIQVKRYSEIAVGLSTVKELGGTLLDKNCKSGMVITTSQFTKGASDYNPSGYNIQKIDGIKLTKLLISFGLGIKTKMIEVKTVDMDYLESF